MPDPDHTAHPKHPRLPPQPERTEDGRYIVIGGRRWRASDPAIPTTLRQELVDELMSARRAVRTDPGTARPRVQDAKVALGERGPQWWDELSAHQRAVRIEATIRALLRHRAGRSICPSDVARVVGGAGWREQMEEVRSVAARLVTSGEVRVTQKGAPVTFPVTGPVRFIAGERFPPD